MTGSATVTFDPERSSPTQLVETIRATGYGAELAPSSRTAIDEQEAKDEAHRHELVSLRRKALASFVAGVVAMILSLPLMAASEHVGSAPPIRSCAGRCTPSRRRFKAHSPGSTSSTRARCRTRRSCSRWV